MGASHHRLGNLTAMVDINALQADGPTAGVLRIEPVTDKWAACGWFVQRVDGNDVDELLSAFDAVAEQTNPTGTTVSHPVRHQDRVRRAAAGEPGEGALHAHRRRRMANLPRATHCRISRRTSVMKTAAPLRTSAMIASFADPGQRTTPAPFGHALVAAAQADDRIVGLTADLGKYTDMHIFAQAFPERYFQMGMAEQLLFGAAAGMAETGSGAVRVHLLGVRRPTRLRLHLPRHRRARTERQHRRRPAGPDHRIRTVPSGHRGRRDLPRHARADHRRPLRLGRHRPGGTAIGRPRRPDLSAAAARPGADGARRVRLHASSSARPKCCGPAPTWCSSRAD